MSSTENLDLPLVQPAQAQKHVTVNEAFGRLDGLTQLSIATIGATSAPGAPGEGDVHSVGASATGDWFGQDGKLALFLNGGWVFVAPKPGWSGWSIEVGSRVVFDGTGWIEGAGSLSANGAGFVHRSVEIDHAVGSGATSSVTGAITADTIVYGVTGRVIGAIGGATTFQIGVSGSADRYGAGIGVAAPAWARGITGSPLTYYADTDIVLTATGGDFDGTGVVRLAVHFAELTLPRA